MKVLSVFLAMLFVCPTVLGQQAGTTDLLIDVRVVSIEDAEWLAFTAEDAKVLLKMRMDFPTLKLSVEALSKSLQIKERIIIMQGGQISNLKEQVGVVKKDNVNLREQLEADRKWYKDPWLWFAIGLGLGVASTAAVVWSTK